MKKSNEIAKIDKELKKILYKISQISPKCISCQKLLNELRQELLRLEDEKEAIIRRSN